MMQNLIREEEMRQKSSCGTIIQINAVMTPPPNDRFSPQDRLRLQRKFQRKMTDWAESRWEN